VFVKAMNSTHFVKQPKLKLKTRPKQLLGFLPLAFELPGLSFACISDSSLIFVSKVKGYSNVAPYGAIVNFVSLVGLKALLKSMRQP
jgi:hypothetical protein